MEPHEVRIHYAANNMVSEDARWMKVARGIAAFKPTTRLQLTDTIVNTSGISAKSSDSHGQTQGSTQPISISPESESASESQSPAREFPNVIDEECCRGRKKRKHSVSSEKSSSARQKRTKGTSFARTRQVLNPVYRRPILRYLKSAKVSRTFVDTPKDRVGLAATVLVPVTESPKRPRKLSDIACTEGYVNQFHSQNHFSLSCVEETSFTDPSGYHTDTSTSRACTSDQARINPRGFDNQSYPCNQECHQERFLQQDHPTRQSFLDRPETLSCSFQTSFEQDEVNLGTQLPQSAHKRSRSTPTGTTATPSDDGIHVNASSPLAQKGKACHRSEKIVVDLTLSPDQTVSYPTRREMLGPVSSPVIQQQGRNTLRNASERAPTKQVFGLPRRAMCKTTCTVKSRPFESFVPRYLLELAERFELPNQFRPVSAPTMMQNSDRGYWNLRIKVTDAEAVAGARQRPPTSSQWSDQRFMMRQDGLVSASASSNEADEALRQSVYPSKDPGTYTQWTARELETFWAYLSKVIERGQAGYDVHATLKCREPISEDSDVDVDVKVYGYAESLSHLWLLLYGVSGTLTASMPLQWHVPGNGPLITMSGQLMHGGSLGRWVSRGTGINGSWGLQDNWDGLSSAINVVGSAEL